MKHLVGKNPVKKVKFNGDEVNVRKLSVNQVFAIQEKSKENEALSGKDAEDASMDLLQFVISSSVEGAKELTREEFRDFPVDELSKLSQEVLSFSGLGNVASA